MTRSRRRWLALCLFAALVGAGVPAPASGQPPTQDDYQDVVERLAETRRLIERAEQREAGLRRGIAATDARRDATRIELEELSAVVAQAQADLDEQAAILARIETSLDGKTEELLAALRRLQASHVELQDRAIQVYKNGPASLLGVVLGASSFGDLVGRVRLLTRIFAKDEARIAQIRDAKARIMAQRDAIDRLRREAASQVAHVRSERDQVAALQRTVNSRWSRLSADLRGQYASLEQVQRDKDRYLREQRELQAESARIASFLRARSGGTASVSPKGMMWPTSGPVTSGYGWRTHPIFGSRRFHSGIDIGAPSGRAVAAAAGGVVAFAGQKNGYGNTVIVDHGGGVATLYGHLSSIGAGTGATVGIGQTIAAVGCTGYCTGPHLHFEVRVNGDPDDPMRWLP